MQWPPKKQTPPAPPKPPNPTPSVTQPTQTTSPPQRSGRQHKAPRNFTCNKPGVASHIQFVKDVSQINNKQTTEACIACWTMLSVDPQTGLLDSFQPTLTPMAFKATREGKDADTPTWEEAMTGPHREAFERAMIKEIKELEARGAWTGMLRSSVPKGEQIVPMTWAFKIKRLPNGELDKFKARTCVRGDLQRIEKNEVCSPVCK